MLDELRGLLGGPVDLVMVGAIKNPYILADIERSKQLLSRRSPFAYLRDVVESWRGDRGRSAGGGRRGVRR